MGSPGRNRFQTARTPSLIRLPHADGDGTGRTNEFGQGFRAAAPRPRQHHRGGRGVLDRHGTRSARICPRTEEGTTATSRPRAMSCINWPTSCAFGRADQGGNASSLRSAMVRLVLQASRCRRGKTAGRDSTRSSAVSRSCRSANEPCSRLTSARPSRRTAVRSWIPHMMTSTETASSAFPPSASSTSPAGASATFRLLRSNRTTPSRRSPGRPRRHRRRVRAQGRPLHRGRRRRARRPGEQRWADRRPRPPDPGRGRPGRRPPGVRDQFLRRHHGHQRHASAAAALVQPAHRQYVEQRGVTQQNVGPRALSSEDAGLRGLPDRRRRRSTR